MMLKHISVLFFVLGLAKAVWLGNLDARSHDPGNSILDSFVSYSIEFAFFVDFAGNLSMPNEFSYNLLANIGHLQRSDPIVRVGGSTQDKTTFNKSQEEGIINTWDYQKNKDQPIAISLGPAFFESYQTWHGKIPYIHGFDLATNGSEGIATLKNTVPLFCKSLTSSNSAPWQIGNEPDQYTAFSRRPKSWNADSWVKEWKYKTQLIRSLVKKHCPNLAKGNNPLFYAPSTSSLGGSPNVDAVWKAGLHKEKDIGFFDVHHYIAGATFPGITLQGTLMNHSNTADSVDSYVKAMSSLNRNLPKVFGEANSLYGQGAPKLSNPFGAALWAADFGLYSASKGIKRIHMHQGTNYRYGSWQPIETSRGTKGTKAPYYGNIMVAAAVSDPERSGVTVQELKQDTAQDSAYAIYVGGCLSRIAIIQMSAYNYTMDYTAPRKSKTFQFRLPKEHRRDRVRGSG
ncbi:glycoside hydrolase family 79 [Fusarium mexicanum]|uniref:Glycoside hydrolase family 79 n=1 Tax=Fusarium mexicanum TaxID=751941 RepID=A0A8H5N6M9_9HYPO|nr:glycoside hydrolase family 79 [Fusarium mexicanum]